MAGPRSTPDPRSELPRPFSAAATRRLLAVAVVGCLLEFFLNYRLSGDGGRDVLIVLVASLMSIVSVGLIFYFVFFRPARFAWSRREDALRESERRLKEAEKTAQLGHFEVDVPTDRVIWSDEALRILGWDASREPLTLAAARRLVHPEDLPRMPSAFLFHPESPASREIDFRSVRPSGEVRHLHCLCDVRTDALGHVEALFGTIQDVTDRIRMEAEARRARAESDAREAKLRAAFQAVPIGLAHIAERKFLEVNDALCASLGFPPDELLGRSTRHLYASEEEFERTGRNVFATAVGRGSTANVHMVRKDGGPLECRMSAALVDPGDPSKGFVVAVIDMTEERRAERRLQERNLQLETLHRIAEAALSEEGMEQAFDRIAEALAQAAGFPIVTIERRDAARRTMEILGSCGGRRERRKSRKASEDGLLSSIVARSGRLLAGSPRELAIGALHPSLGAPRAQCVICLPLGNKGNVFGALTFAAGGTRAVNDDEILWLSAVAVFVSIVVERKIGDEENRNLLRAVNQSPVSIVITDPDGDITYVNPRFTSVSGWSAEEAIGKNPRILKSGHHRPREYQELWATIKAGREWRGELLNQTRDGRLFWELASISPVRDSTGRITHFVAVKEEVTQRKKDEKELTVSRERLRALSERLISLQEEERKAFARELHDGLGQTLTGLTFGLRWIQPRLRADQTGLAEKIDELAEELARAIDEVRDMTRRLRPSSLDIGLPAALETEIAAFSKRTGLKCALNVSPEPLQLDGPRATALFRIAQEALTNVARHANATHVAIHLLGKGNHVQLEVTDDGCGFEQGALSSSKGLGLVGMRERAAMFFGRATLHRCQPRGSRLVALIPLSSQDEKGESE